MGNESQMHTILKNEKPPAVENEIVERAPTKAEVTEMESLLKRVSGERVVPEEETLDKETRLARSREILKELFAESRRKDAEAEKVHAAGAQTENPAKWTDPRYHNGRNR